MARLSPSSAGHAGAFRGFLRARFGLWVDDERLGDLAWSVRRASNELGVSEEQLLVLVGREDPDAVETLLSHAVVSETYFFRNRAFFDVLAERIVPEVVDRNADARSLRVWCAGCASGEEPYSIAAVVRDALTGRDDWNVLVLGTDVDRRALRKARRGVYRTWSFRDVPERVRDRWFERQGDEYDVSAVLRELTEFRHLNLAEPSLTARATRGGSFDLIVCRNVLMYLDASVRERVVDALSAALAPGGWLVLGPTDAVPRSDILDVETSPAGLLCRRSAPSIDGAVVEPEGADLPNARSAGAGDRSVPSSRSRGGRPASGARRRRAAGGGARGQAPGASARGARIASEATDEEALRNLDEGLRRYDRGDIQGALDAIRSALYARPDLLAARCAAGILLVRLGEVTRGRQLLRTVVTSTEAMAPGERLEGPGDVTAGTLRELAQTQLELMTESDTR